MLLDNYLKDDLILIIPYNLKSKIIEYLSSLNNLYNIKIMTFEELKKHLLFNYNSKTINYIMKENNISYSNALELINNMYFLFDDKYDNKKIDNLNNLKKELIENKLLIFDQYFKKGLKSKEIIIYGFDYINRFNLKLVDILKSITKTTIIKKEYEQYIPVVHNFLHLNYEIEFIANDILTKKIPLNNVYIYGTNKDNINTVKRIFNNYNININLPPESSLYETKIGYELLNNLKTIENYLESIKDANIKKQLINILNNYYWINNKEDIKEMLIYELKHVKLQNPKYDNAVNITELFNEYFNDNDYVYIIDFNNPYIPKIYKDTDFICDSEKFPFLETSIEKSIIEKENWYKVICGIKNLTITSINQNLNGILKPSTLVSDYNIEFINEDYKISNYSNESNLYNLGLLLDEYQKYGSINKELPNLISTYPNHNYLSYNNKYSKIKYKDNFKYNLSYSKMNAYYECPFKFYCDNILKLNQFEDTFDTYLGSLIHFILSKIYEPTFDFEQAKNDFLENNSFELTLENKMFLNKILDELKDAIKYIKSFQNITKYQSIETEKRIITNINDIDFIGIIDKMLSYDNNYVLIDYKTGNPDIDLRLASFGLNLQLPTYAYLIKSIYPNSNITGIYLEHVLKPLFNKEKDLTIKEQYEKSLKLMGYTLGDESKLKDFDPTYENSEYIHGLKLTSNGFSSYSKVLTKNNFEKLAKLTEEKIIECISNINKANFVIEPKIVNGENITCAYCKYKSVCFKTEKDNKYISLDNNLAFLEGDENELD